MTRTTLRDAIKRRLGIESDITLNAIWSDTELNSYIQEAYLKLARDTGLHFGVDTVNCVDGTATYTIPSDVLQIDRVLHDGQRIPPSYGRDVRMHSPGYRTLEGTVYTYMTDEDGPYTIRLVMIPSATGSTYTITGTWGIMRSPADITAATVTGTWGTPRRLPGQQVSRGQWGIPRQVLPDTSNLRLESRRSGIAVTQDDQAFELPDQFCRFLQWFVLAKAYTRDGPGQDLQLAQHYQERWDAAIERVKGRMAHATRSRTGVMGHGASRFRTGVALPRLPWNYPPLAYHSRR